MKVSARHAAGFLSCLAALVLLAACGTTTQSPVRPPFGLLFTDVSYPLTTDYADTPVGEKVRNAREVRTQMIWDYLLTGMSVGWGNADVGNLAQQHGISEVYYAEVRTQIILALYYRQELAVFGK